MRRLFWVGVGVGVTVVVVVKGRQVAARFAPSAVVDAATGRLDDAGARGLELVRVFRTEFGEARARREAELRASLLAEGQVPAEPASARHRRAAAEHDEDLLGYSFF
ncbi:hypothetical protein [Cellulomonas sp. PhB143]|uniref:hypothetical protein n=1 Tax=Cellulomonas sp. PhB143 TaxID=2485186 RepID=UPI000F48002C|nr:hypothetical protein [Cellulomonas sp. PhB143]ROS74557.1 hypothetical protein EDF32_2304 [Cellulomonas sp. PhB143]